MPVCVSSLLSLWRKRSRPDSKLLACPKHWLRRLLLRGTSLKRTFPPPLSPRWFFCAQLNHICPRAVLSEDAVEVALGGFLPGLDGFNQETWAVKPQTGRLRKALRAILAAAKVPAPSSSSVAETKAFVLFRGMSCGLHCYVAFSSRSQRKLLRLRRLSWRRLSSPRTQGRSVPPSCLSSCVSVYALPRSPLVAIGARPANCFWRNCWI